MDGPLKFLKKAFFSSGFVQKHCAVSGSTLVISEKLGDKKPMVVDLRTCTFVKDTVCLCKIRVFL